MKIIKIFVVSFFLYHTLSSAPAELGKAIEDIGIFGRFEPRGSDYYSKMETRIKELIEKGADINEQIYRESLLTNMMDFMLEEKLNYEFLCKLIIMFIEQKDIDLYHPNALVKAIVVMRKTKKSEVFKLLQKIIDKLLERDIDLTQGDKKLSGNTVIPLPTAISSLNFIYDKLGRDEDDDYLNDEKVDYFKGLITTLIEKEPNAGDALLKLLGSIALTKDELSKIEKERDEKKALAKKKWKETGSVDSSLNENLKELEKKITPLEKRFNILHDLVLKLIKHEKANLNIIDKYGYRPLTMAIDKLLDRKDGWDIIDALIDSGADVNAQDKAWPQHTPLTGLFFCFNGLTNFDKETHDIYNYMINLAKKLIKKGAKDQPDGRGQMSLSLAIANIQGKEVFDIVQMLIDQGADVNAVSKLLNSDETPLHNAIRKLGVASRKEKIDQDMISAYKKVITLLIEKGANPYVVINDETAFAKADRLLEGKIKDEVKKILEKTSVKATEEDKKQLEKEKNKAQEEKEKLEEERLKELNKAERGKAATIIQALARSKLARDEYQKIKDVTENIEALARGHLERKKFEQLKDATTKIQALARGTLDRNKYEKSKEAATTIQALLRGKLEKNKQEEMKKNIVTIQSLLRGKLSRDDLKKEEEKRLKEEQERLDKIEADKLRKAQEEADEKERLEKEKLLEPLLTIALKNLKTKLNSLAKRLIG